MAGKISAPVIAKFGNSISLIHVRGWLKQLPTIDWNALPLEKKNVDLMVKKLNYVY